jgi:hypothetical protein
MYHLAKSLYLYATSKEEYSVLLLGLDNAGKSSGEGGTNDGTFEDIQEVEVEDLCAAMIVSPRACLPLS